MKFVCTGAVDDITTNVFNSQPLSEGVMSFSLLLKSISAQWNRDVKKDWSKAKDVWIQAVKNCETKEDIAQLRKDYQSVKALEKRLEKVKGSKEHASLEKHIEWIRTLGKQMLDKKAEDLKVVSKEEKEKGTWEGKKK